MNTVTEPSLVERAIVLREKGWSFRRIAKVLEISVGTAFNYVHGTYAESDEAHAKREHLQQLERARLDRVIRRVDRALRSPDDEVAVKAAAVLIKASESRRKLDGLDAPTKVEKTEPDEVAKMTDAEKLEAHRKAAAELEQKIAGQETRH